MDPISQHVSPPKYDVIVLMLRLHMTNYVADGTFCPESIVNVQVLTIADMGYMAYATRPPNGSQQPVFNCCFLVRLIR